MITEIEESKIIRIIEVNEKKFILQSETKLFIFENNQIIKTIETT